MANAITLAKTFIPILDKIYKRASLTSYWMVTPSWCARAQATTR